MWYIGPPLATGAGVERMTFGTNMPSGNIRWDSDLNHTPPVPGITIGDGEVFFDNVTLWSASGTQVLLDGGPLTD